MMDIKQIVESLNYNSILTKRVFDDELSISHSRSQKRDTGIMYNSYES